MDQPDTLADSYQVTLMLTNDGPAEAPWVRIWSLRLFILGGGSHALARVEAATAHDAIGLVAAQIGRR